MPQALPSYVCITEKDYVCSKAPKFLSVFMGQPICYFFSLWMTNSWSLIYASTVALKHESKLSRNLLWVKFGRQPVFLTFIEPRNRLQWMNAAGLCSLAGRYDNPIPTRFLVPVDCLKIPALDGPTGSTYFFSVVFTPSLRPATTTVFGFYPIIYS